MSGGRKASDGQTAQGNAVLNFEVALRDLSSNVWGAVKEPGAEGGLIDIRIKLTDDNDYFCIVKRLCPDDGTPQVIFADGESIADVFRNVGRAMAKDKWRTDKPWKPDK